MAKLEPNQHFLEVAVIVSLMTCLFSIILPTASRQSFLFFTLDLSGKGSHCIGRSLTEEISMTSTISYEVIESILFRHIGKEAWVGGKAFVQTVNGSNETADWISLLLLRKLKSSSDSVGNTKIIAVNSRHAQQTTINEKLNMWTFNADFPSVRLYVRCCLVLPRSCWLKQSTEVQDATFLSRTFYQLELHGKPILKAWNTLLYTVGQGNLQYLRYSFI